MPFPTDDELVGMSTVQLRELVEQGVITTEQHKDLRMRRRRLQNRKYARRCAKKKQTEVAELEAAANRELTMIRSLRHQMSRLNTSVDLVNSQLDSVKRVFLAMERSEGPYSLRMVDVDGQHMGMAFFRHDALIAASPTSRPAAAAAAASVRASSCSTSSPDQRDDADDASIFDPEGEASLIPRSCLKPETIAEEDEEEGEEEEDEYFDEQADSRDMMVTHMGSRLAIGAGGSRFPNSDVENPFGGSCLRRDPREGRT